MPRVLFLIPSLQYSGLAKQLVLLASGLGTGSFSEEGLSPAVCVLGEETPWLANLALHQLEVECLGWQRLFEVQPLLRLRDLIRTQQPAVVHVFGLPALRALALSAGLGRQKIVVSGPLGGRTHLNLLDRWLLARADAVIVQSQAESVRAQRAGIRPGQLVCIPPGVVPVLDVPDSRAEVFRQLRLPTSAKLVVGVGPLKAEKSFRDVIWALDILRYLYTDLHLVLVGSGEHQARLEQFCRHIQMLDRVHFVGPQASVVSWLAAADVVCAPSANESGLNTILEAMSLGKVVVGTQVPGLAEVIVDQQTGLLAPINNQAALASKIRFVLDHPEEQARLGLAARERAESQYSAQALLARFAQLYRLAC